MTGCYVEERSMPLRDSSNLELKVHNGYFSDIVKQSGIYINLVSVEEVNVRKMAF